MLYRHIGDLPALKENGIYKVEPSKFGTRGLYATEDIGGNLYFLTEDMLSIYFRPYYPRPKIEPFTTETVTSLHTDAKDNIIASTEEKKSSAERFREAMEEAYKKKRPLITLYSAAGPEPDETSASFTVPDGYMDLALTLIDAFNQAARGKGNERHAKGRRFDDQPIRNIPRVQGNISGLVYQMMKKANEADMMHERGEHDPAIREFYGVINYAAAAILHIKDQKGKDDGG